MQLFVYRFELWLYMMFKSVNGMTTKSQLFLNCMIGSLFISRITDTDLFLL